MTMSAPKLACGIRRLRLINSIQLTIVTALVSEPHKKHHRKTRS